MSNEAAGNPSADPAEFSLGSNVSPVEISRRSTLEGLFASFIAAPAVIRTPGLLMPVRNRILPQMYDEYGMRDYRSYPPTLDEVKSWRASMNRLCDQGIMVSWNAWGFNQIAAMGDAGRSYEAMGLL